VENAAMNRRRRFSVCRSFSIETLERRSMLAADSVEGSFAVEATDLSDEVFQVAVFQESPSEACSLPYEASEDSPLPFEAVPMDDTANGVPVSDEAEPVTDPEEPFIGMDSGMEDGQALEASFSLLVCPPVFEFETMGWIACEPAVSVEPFLALDVTTCGSLQFFDGDDIWNNVTFVESGLQLTSEIVDLSTNRGWDADTIKVVWDEPVVWCGVGVQTDTGDLDTVAAPVESPAAGSTSDDEALVVAASSGGSSPSTATSAATAQAFATFAASFGPETSFSQGGGDVQSGLPFVGGRRAARR
jgi:hypothetical protein